MNKKKTSSSLPFAQLLWLSLIGRASNFRIFSQKRRKKLNNSFSKRLDRLIIRLEDMADVTSNKGGLRRARAIPKDGQIKRANSVHLDPTHFAYKILIVCEHAPTVNHAGGLRILDMIRMIKSKMPLAYVEVFTSANKDLYGPIDKVLQLADRVVIAQDYNFTLAEYLRQTSLHEPYFDVIDFQFPQPVELIASYRDIGDKLIFTPMESYIRNVKIMQPDMDSDSLDRTAQQAVLEEEIIKVVDLAVCVSEMDRASILEHMDADVVAIETGISEIEFSGDTKAANSIPLNVCYVAYFGSETNRVALKWYLEHVHPIVLAEVPDYTFTIVGRGDVTEILTPMPEGLNYVGEVEKIGPYIKGATVGIAPALFGSGFRGKVNQYAYFGVPTVASPLSAEGLAYEDETSILVADEPQDFARAIIRLLSDKPLQERLALAAQEVTSDNYTWESKWPAMAEVYGLPQSVELLNEPTIHAVVPSYQHADFIEERIRSIFAQEYSHIRVTVIDDHSTDGSDEIIKRLREEFDFEYIRREENSGTPFSAWEYAARNSQEDMIWICESDDAADPTFVPKLVKLLGSRDSAKIAYSGSWVVDEHGTRLGSSAEYHRDAFCFERWDTPFIGRGTRELDRFVRFGMIVPNMSSALIDSEIFRKAFTDNIKNYRLAGDWLFIGQALQHCDIVYTPELLNRFRQHEQTSRHSTKRVRSYVEHISVRLSLSALVDANELQCVNAIKHELLDFLSEPDFKLQVQSELNTFNPEYGDKLKSLTESFLSKSTAKEDLEEMIKLKNASPNLKPTDREDRT